MVNCILKEITFPDHYDYSQANIEKIKLQAKNLNAKIITTEKDYVKIARESLNKINFLGIDLVIKNEDELITFIKSKI